MYAISMTEGQICRTRTPPVGHPDQVKWQRYATGLYHPIGLAVVDGRLYVAQKPEITELIVPVQTVELSPDRTAITLTFPVETYPIGMVYEINLGKLTDAEGENLLHNEAWYTVHKIPQ